MSAPRDPIGFPARVVVTKTVRTMYRVDWEYDGHVVTGGGDVVAARRRQAHFTVYRRVAYRQAAARMIFSRRDRLATAVEAGFPVGCSLCDEEIYDPEDPTHCRYHGGHGFEVLRRRLARWLMWRDDRRAASQEAI